MLEWCAAIECPVHVLLTKADKLKRRAADQGLAQVRRELGPAVTVQLFSGLSGQGSKKPASRCRALLSGARRGAPD